MRISVKLLAVMALTVSVVLPLVAWAGGDVSTVNKSITIDSNASAEDVDSVNGSIRISDRAVVRSVESVNGAISIREDAKVERDVSAVNGTINLAEGTEVGGSVETVNGSIRLRDAVVAGDVQTVNGGIKLLNGSQVEGNVVVRKPQGWSNKRRKPVKVEIGEGVQVFGDLIFEHPVELTIHGSASYRELIGDDVEIVEG